MLALSDRPPAPQRECPEGPLDAPRCCGHRRLPPQGLTDPVLRQLRVIVRWPSDTKAQPVFDRFTLGLAAARRSNTLSGFC